MSPQSHEYGPGSYVFDAAELDSDFACSAFNTGNYRAFGISMPIVGLFCEVEHNFGKLLPQNAEKQIDYPAIVRKIDHVFASREWQLETAPQSNIVVVRKECRLRQHHDGTKGSVDDRGVRNEFFSTIIVAEDGASSVAQALPAVDESMNEHEREASVVKLADMWPPSSLPLLGALEFKAIRSFRSVEMPIASIAISGLEHVIYNYEVPDLEHWL